MNYVKEPDNYVDIFRYMQEDCNMKIVVVNGQNHRGSTCHIGELFVESIPGEKAIETFFLPRDLNHFCTGCYTCIEYETRCPFFTEKNLIMQAIEKADILVFTTPNYCMAPSAPMKSFMDFTFTYWVTHKPRGCMFSKRAFVFATTAGAGAQTAIKPVKRMLFYWGVPWIKTFGTNVFAMNWESVPHKKKEQIQRVVMKLAVSFSPEKKPCVSVASKFVFFMMRGMQAANMGSGKTERDYWENHGWLGKERPWKKP